MLKIIAILKKAWAYMPYIFAVTALAFYGIAMYRCGRDGAAAVGKGAGSIKSDTTATRHTDTIPRLQSERMLGYMPFVYRAAPRRTRTKSMPNYATAEADSTPEPSRADTIQIPVTQRVYSGPGYTAYVSGYRPALDSISVEERIVTNTVTMPRKRAPRLTVGFQIGYGITTKGLLPYAGIGIQYNIFR